MEIQKQIYDNGVSYNQLYKWNQQAPNDDLRYLRHHVRSQAKVHSLILHTKREKRDYNAYKKQVQKCYKYPQGLITGLDPI